MVHIGIHREQNKGAMDYEHECSMSGGLHERLQRCLRRSLYQCEPSRVYTVAQVIVKLNVRVKGDDDKQDNVGT